MPFGWFSNRNAARSRPESERRSTMRVKLELDAELLMPEGRKIRCTVADLSIRGAELRVHEVDRELVEGEDTCELVVLGPRGQWRVSSEVLVRSRKRSDPGWMRVGVEFTCLGDLYGQLETSMAPFFNRRGSRRISIAPEDGLSVALGRGRGRTSARVRDISARGVSVIYPRLQGAGFEVDSRIDIAIKLPNAKKELVGKAFVRYVERLDQRVMMGLEFDLCPQGGMRRHARTLRRFVRRQERSLQRVLRAACA